MDGGKIKSAGVEDVLRGRHPVHKGYQPTRVYESHGKIVFEFDGTERVYKCRGWVNWFLLSKSMGVALSKIQGHHVDDEESPTGHEMCQVWVRVSDLPAVHQVRAVARRAIAAGASQPARDGNKLSHWGRSTGNTLLRKAGLDGNGRFRSMGEATNAMWGVLEKIGIEQGEVVSANRFRNVSGSTAFDMAWSNQEDPFSPTPIHNSRLAVSWTLLAPNRYEVVAYLS